MKVETREIYKCEYCNKLYQRKHLCLKHETSCVKNPTNARPCLGCSHLTTKSTTLYSDNPFGGEDERQVELMYCDKVGTFLHTPQVEIKGNSFETEDLPNNPMPKECEHFSSDLLFL